MEKFFALESKQKLTNAKKLLKARNSSVLTMDRKTLLDRLKAHSRYSAMFAFEDDHVVINSQKDAATFIKMLNDDIVRSELTGQEYDSILADIDSIHRITVYKATARKDKDWKYTL